MRLHRAEASEWDGLAPRQLNTWQRLAVRSGGLITPGNLMSVAGGLIVAYGLYDLARGHLIAGIVVVLAGRGADVLDGMIAEATSTKSPLGEAVDATMDKILLGLTLIVLLTNHLLPLIVGLLMAAQGVYNSLLALIAKYRSVPIKLHPSLTGKLSTAFEWLSVGLYLLADQMKHHSQMSEHASLIIAGLSFGLFMILAVLSSLDYSRQFISQRRP